MSKSNWMKGLKLKGVKQNILAMHFSVFKTSAESLAFNVLITTGVAVCITITAFASWEVSSGYTR